MTNKTTQKALAMFLALVMLFSLIPGAAFADDGIELAEVELPIVEITEDEEPAAEPIPGPEEIPDEPAADDAPDVPSDEPVGDDALGVPSEEEEELSKLFEALALSDAEKFEAGETTTIEGVSTPVYEVASGFYQNSATYAASTDFYINSEAGLKYFRDLVSACDDGTIAAAYATAWTGSDALNLYQGNIFSNKTVHLLADIDLENQDWTPIGYTNTAFNSGNSKTQFYGSFDGHGHKISNLKLIGSTSNYFIKSGIGYGAYGLFGSLGSRAGQTFSNLTIENVSGVSGTETWDYVGAIVGNAGSNAVSFVNCHVTGTINLTASYQVGGIYGIGSGTLTGCSTVGTGTISSEDYYAAGLAGCARAGVTVSECTVSGVEIDAAYAGGLTGLNNSNATFATNTIQNATINGTETAGYNDCKGTKEAAVTAGTTASNVTIPITGIDVTGESNTVFAGSTLQLTASPIPETTTQTLGTVTWSSDKSDVATVSEDGVVTPVGIGTATITAAVGDLSGTYSVTVKAVASLGSGSSVTTSYLTFDDLAQAWGASYEAGTITLQQDVSLDSNKRLNIDKDVTIDLNGYTISGTNSYVLYIRNNSKVTLKTTEGDPTAGGVTGTSTYGVYTAADSELTISGGSYTAYGYAVANVGTTTIDDGDFVTTNYSYTINNYNGTMLRITGGTFNKNTANYGTQEISGGYFGVKPNETYIAAGYGVVYDDEKSMYHVVPADQIPVAAATVIDTDGTTVVQTYATLAEAITAATEGQTISLNEGVFELPATAVIAKDVTITGAGARKTSLLITTTNGDGVKLTNSGVKIENVTIDGKNITSGGYYSLVNVEADGCEINNVVMTGGGKSTWDSSILVERLTAEQTFTVKNSTISGSFRGVLRESCNANIVIDNCDITATYPFNIDGGNGGTVTVTESALHGWTSYSGVDKVTFTNVEFSKGNSSYNAVAAYVDTKFENCSFNTGNSNAFNVYAQTGDFTFTFNDCEKDGVAITDENLTTLFSDDGVWTECETAIDVATTENGEYTSGTVVSTNAPDCAESSVSLKIGRSVDDSSNVFKIGTRVEITDPVYSKTAEDGSAEYAVDLKLYKDNDTVIYEKTNQKIVLKQGENLTAISSIDELSDVVKAGLEAVGPMATDVDTITLSLVINSLTADVENSCKYSAALVGVPTDANGNYLTETGSTSTKSTYPVKNDVLTGNFSFNLSVDSITGVAKDDPIQVTHHSDDTTFTDTTETNHVRGESGNYYVEIMTNHFSTFTLVKIPSVPATGMNLDSWAQLKAAGDTIQLNAGLIPENSTDEVTWTSSNTAVATVDARGNVTAVADGLTIITARANDSVAATCAVRVTPNMSYNTFVTALMGNSGTFDGSSYSDYAHDSNGRLIVSWSPQSGCRAVGTNNHQNNACDKLTRATYETPDRVNSGCAQFRLFGIDAAAGGEYTVNISNVSFVYTLAGDQANEGFWCDANGWNNVVPGDDYEAGELQLENHGDITINNCAFRGVALTPFHEGATTNHSLTVTNSVFTDIAKAGLRGINSKQVTVTGCTFTNCDSGAVDIVPNNNRVDGDIVLTDNIINGANGFKLRKITNKVYVKGERTALTVDKLFSYDTENTAVADYLILSAGTYNLDPSDTIVANSTSTNFVAEGYAARNNGDGTWTICRKLIATATDQEIPYGTSISTGTNKVQVIGLPEGLTLAEITLTPSTASIAQPGSITPSGAKIVDAQGADVTADFVIEYKPGVLTIIKAAPTPATVTAKTITWTGSAQQLVTVDTSTLVGGTMQYATGTDAKPTGAWSADIPTGTEVGTYYVWYKVIGDENHNDSEPARVTVPIQEKTYKITYNANGGKNAPAAQQKSHGETIKLSAEKPTHENDSREIVITLNPNGGSVGVDQMTAIRTYTYTFRRWNTRSNGAGTNYAAGASYTENADATLYAQWRVSATSNPARLELPAPEREGYTFTGWALSKNGTSPTMSTVIPTYGHTRYAQWEINQYTVTFDTGDGGTEIAPITQDYGTAITAPANPTREGYTFKGWDPALPATMPADNINVKAQWEINHYTVSYDANGGTGTMTDLESYDHGSEVPVPENAFTAPKNHSFAGWNTAADGSGKTYQPDDTFTITADTTLYAQWSRMEVKFSSALNLTDSFNLRLYIYGLEDYEGLTVSWEKKDGTPEDHLVTEGAFNPNYAGGAYIFQIEEFNATEMLKAIPVTVKDQNGEELGTAECSVNRYCELVFEKSQNDKLRTLCRAVQDYGTYAQRYFGVDTDKVPNPVADATALGTVPESYEHKLKNNCTGITSGALSLALESKPNLNVYFNLASGYTAANYEVTAVSVSGEDLKPTVTMAGSAMVVTIPEIAVINLGKSMTVTVRNTEDGTEAVFNGSALSYAYMSRDDASKHDVVRGLYDYYLKAIAYFS